MKVKVCFYSYFNELAGCPEATEELPPGTTLSALIRAMGARFPKLAAMEKSMLVAVGVDYQGRDYVLQEGDEVAFFPPVQGG